MTVASLLKDYAAYNLWANTQMVEWLQNQPPELMEREVPSSFSSLQLTLLHIWGAEEIWLQRLQQIQADTFLFQTFQGGTGDVFTGILHNSKIFLDYVQAQSEAYFQEICPFRLFNGTEDARPRAEMLLHCFQHSTYHRGQLVTIARNLGLTEPPKTDFIHYARIREQSLSPLF